MDKATERSLHWLEKVSAEHKAAKAEERRLKQLRDKLMYRLRWRKMVPNAEIARRAGLTVQTVKQSTPPKRALRITPTWAAPPEKEKAALQAMDDFNKSV